MFFTWGMDADLFVRTRGGLINLMAANTENNNSAIST
jgi:hypothetical protein